MLRRSARRFLPAISRQSVSARPYSTPTDNPSPANNPNPKDKNSPVSSTNAVPTSAKGSHSQALQEEPLYGEQLRVTQAPNRASTWSRSQQPRSNAMVGPRFEQTIMEDQPRPLAAIELIHQQPVTWTKERVVSCNGGGGPLGHPRIFINVDKPEIAWCNYCGLPFAHEHHRKHLESLPSTTYPLASAGGPAQIPQSDIGGAAESGATSAYQSNTGAPYEQRFLYEWNTYADNSVEVLGVPFASEGVTSVQPKQAR